eukprot:Hpha_TRINITY_DN19035_c0_g1::TRINITY_DN19035_c0_g1_i1::g.138265::m.138265
MILALLLCAAAGFSSDTEVFRHRAVRGADAARQVLTRFQGPNGKQGGGAVEFLAGKLARVIVHQQPFVVAELGDTCGGGTFRQRYEKAATWLLEAAGVKLVVRAAGGVSRCSSGYAQEIWCLRQLAGDDVDLLIDNWGQDDPASRESLLRWGLLLDKAPALHVAGGPLCKGGTDPLAEGYRDLGYTVFCPRGSHSVVDAAVQFLSSAIVLAGNMVLQAGDEAVVKWKARPSVLRVSLMPDPKACEAEWCGQEEPPGCRLQHKPEFGRPQIGIDDVDGSLNPYADEGPAPGAEGWRAAPQETVKGCSQATCGMLEGSSTEDGWLSFALPRMQVGMLFVCCCCASHCAKDQLKEGVVEFARRGADRCLGGARAPFVLALSALFAPPG